MVQLLSCYEQTIGKINRMVWERKTNIDGSFSKNDTGNLTMTAKEANLEEFFQTTYLSITRPKGEKVDELCLSVKEILLKKFHPLCEDEAMKKAIKNETEIVIPLPIMLADGDNIMLFQPEDGKARGITFRVETKE